MPPKAKFTREEVIETALDIVRQKGMKAVTARELASRLESSPRPIFSIFCNMEEVQAETIQAAKELYSSYVLQGLRQKIPFKGVGIQYIRFAMEEPRLFQLLFMTGQEDRRITREAMLLDENSTVILETIQKAYALEADVAARLYLHLWIYTHGIATLCATGVAEFKDEEISSMLTEIFSGVLQAVKKK